MREVPTGAAEVNVGAYRWGWNFDYGSGINQPELHVVKDEPTELIMQSSDVIHSLFIPAFRVKRDVVPGRYNRLWFTATKASEKVSDEELERAKKKAETENNGVFDPKQFGFTRHGYKFYDLYCTEYCGKDHSMMQSFVVVHETRDDFEAWLEDADKKPEGMSMEAYGRILYEQQGCKSCHSLDGSRVVGPSFLNIYGRAEQMASGEAIEVDENYLRESILEPMAKIVEGYPKAMPSYKGRLSEEKLNALIAFLKTVK
jgi:cytochrome c oxidase subunit 2